jgi:hypothetical protein
MLLNGRDAVTTALADALSAQTTLRDARQLLRHSQERVVQSEQRVVDSEVRLSSTIGYLLSSRERLLARDGPPQRRTDDRFQEACAQLIRCGRPA